jgi:hypothetical protein
MHGRNIVGQRSPPPPHLRSGAHPDIVAQTDGFLARTFANVILRTLLYYGVLFTVGGWLWQLPQAQAVVQGSMEALIASGGTFPGFGPPRSAPPAAGSVDATVLSMTVAAAMIGAVLLALPVAWIYGLTRQKKGYQQSVVQTLMVLPPLVAGVVVLVKYSLALAFSLAGIVAAVRFRNTLEDSKDAVYIFLATAIGLAAAVQLPVAAVISVVFNLIILGLWYTDFGKSSAYEGERAKKRLEAQRAKLRQTGSFVAMLDHEIFENMTPEQLELAADRAWRRRRRIGTDAPEDDEMQRRDVLLRIRTKEPDTARVAVEGIFDDFLKKWRFGGVIHEADGTHVVEYAVQLKKATRSSELLDAVNAKQPVTGVEIK